MSALSGIDEAEPVVTLAATRQRLSAAQQTWIGFAAMLFGNFIAILDVQIVASSVNEIRAGLSATTEEVSWVQTAYLIAEVIAIPLSGFLSRGLSTRLYFAACALGFTLASLACAMATSLPQLIAFRVVQGAFAGGLIPTTMSALYAMFPPARRRLPYVLIGMVSLVAPAVGAATGGAITHSFSWPWLFLINLVPGLLVTALVLRHVDIDRPQPWLLRRTDFLGFVGLAAFLGSLQYVLEEGPRHDWFESHSIRAFALLSVLGLALLLQRVRRAAEPIVDLSALRDRNFVIGCLSSFVIGVMLYGIVFIIPTFLGLVRGYDSLQVGHITMLSGISMFLSAPLAGRLQEKIDPRLLIAYGLGMVALGDWCNAGLSTQSDFWTFLVPQLIRGHGFTFALVPMTIMTLGTLPPERVKGGSGLFNLMRNLGGAFGIAGIQTALRDGHAEHFRHLSDSLSPAREPLREALASAQRLLPQLGGDSHPPQLLMLVVRAAHRQALVLAYNETLLMLAALMLLPVLLLLLARKPALDPLARED